MKKSYLTKKDFEFIDQQLDGILDNVCDVECAGYDVIYDLRLEIMTFLKEITEKESQENEP